MQMWTCLEAVSPFVRHSNPSLQASVCSVQNSLDSSSLRVPGLFLLPVWWDADSSLILAASGTEESD